MMQQATDSLQQSWWQIPEVSCEDFSLKAEDDHPQMGKLVFKQIGVHYQWKQAGIIFVPLCYLRPKFYVHLTIQFKVLLTSFISRHQDVSTIIEIRKHWRQLLNKEANHLSFEWDLAQRWWNYNGCWIKAVAYKSGHSQIQHQLSQSVGLHI